MKKKPGKIILVGSGPGDPGLITVRGVEAIKKAEALVYDYLVNPELLSYASDDCEMICVGKKAGCHTMPQEEINRLLAERAGEGKIVVRLKGGDPFVFGRGGEEALFAARAGISFEVVSGVTAGVAAPAYAGIPVTQRGTASTVTFITGHEDPRKKESHIDWEQLARGGGTLVFYMGVGRLGEIARELTGHGTEPETPVAVVHRGTTEQQETVVGTLADIEQKAKEEGIKPPAIIVVGEVVELRKELRWFESRPLFGRTVLVTRAREQASEFSQGLESLGARVIEMPAIRIGESPEPEAVKETLGRSAEYDWIIFTSVNGVKKMLYYLYEAGLDIRALGRAKLASIGPMTAGALESLGLRVDLVPESYVAEEVAEAMKKRGSLKGKKILLPRAEKARETLPETLRSLGAAVDEVALYSTMIEKPENLGQVREDLARGAIDAVTFTSSSTVDNFIKLIGRENLAIVSRKTVFAAIGPVTAKTAESYGLEIAVSPAEFTIEGLTGALCEYFGKV